MFTSRAEYRLSLRADNADQRLTPLGIELGLVKDARKSAFEAKRDALSRAKEQLTETTYTPQDLVGLDLKIRNDGTRRTAYELLAFPDMSFEKLVQLDDSLDQIDEEVKLQVARDALYANYIERQQKDVEALKRDEAHVIPDDFSYSGLSGLSNELASKLQAARPRTLAHASRVEGMTPAALTLLLSKIRQFERKRTA